MELEIMLLRTASRATEYFRHPHAITSANPQPIATTVKINYALNSARQGAKPHGAGGTNDAMWIFRSDRRH